MALSVTAHSSSAPTSVSSITFSVTVSTSGSVIVVAAGAFDGTTASNTHVTGVTYNGVSFALVDSVANPAANTNASNYTYILQNVASGTANLVVTFAGTCSNPSAAYAVFAGAATTGQPDAHTVGASLSFTASGASKSITTVADNCLVWGFCDMYNNSTVNPSGTNQTKLDGWGGGFNVDGYTTNPVTPAGSVTMSYSNGVADQGDIFLISIAPSASTPTTVKNLGLLGVG